MELGVDLPLVQQHLHFCLEMATKWKKLAHSAGLFESEDCAALNVDNITSLDEVSAELFVKFLRIPSAKNYSSLQKKLQNCTPEWMTEFLQINGLASLFEVIEKLSDRGFARFSDVFVQMECVRCVKAVMSSKTGLEYVAQSPESVYQLAKGMHVFPCHPLY